MELKNSNVQFIPEGHKYLLGDIELQGITSTLIKAVFGDYTEDIPEETLQKAAERGTAIHEEIARIDAGESFATSYEELEYTRLRDALGLVPVASEYIVTDGKTFASPIDKVYEGDVIADIKTTSKLHYEQAALQLSWYAAYYEQLNKRKVEKAYIIHLPREQYGTCQAIEVKLQTPALIKKIVADYLAGEDVTGYASRFEMKLPAKANEVVAKIKAKTAQLELLQKQLAEMREILEKAFIALGVKEFENDLIRIIRIEPTVRVTLDSKAVAKRYPDVYEECKRESAVKGSVRITLKDNNIND